MLYKKRNGRRPVFGVGVVHVVSRRVFTSGCTFGTCVVYIYVCVK